MVSLHKNWPWDSSHGWPGLAWHTVSYMVGCSETSEDDGSEVKRRCGSATALRVFQRSYHAAWAILPVQYHAVHVTLQTVFLEMGSERVESLSARGS